MSDEIPRWVYAIIGALAIATFWAWVPALLVYRACVAAGHDVVHWPDIRDTSEGGE